ncbi:hypothetical protein DAPPUDRAFT_307696 [Daphnia pulex]|uniref:Uncharacterized protein n=1 Tax=Daphnia pulex TaxID=6669 RepID=E9H464_DAPPU|nr:hypothetical protein DAPPUDRAFT_307696 [Daphnia pulex]|eukprot:EFX73491.1 hypothetical protein DAPPUDRAFT_307696 [Daphnia pulex]
MLARNHFAIIQQSDHRITDLAGSSAVGQKFSDLYWVLLQLTKQPLFFFSY